MEDIEIQQLKDRKKVLEQTMTRLAELIQQRNHVLYLFEKYTFDKILKNRFSNLNTISRNVKLNEMILIKKNCELDLKLCRRGQFFLSKRKRVILEEIEFITQTLAPLEAEIASQELSTEKSQDTSENSPPHSE